MSEKKVFAILYKFKEEMLNEINNINNNQQYPYNKVNELESQVKMLINQSDYQLREYPTKNFMKYFVEETEKQVKNMKEDFKGLENRIQELELNEDEDEDEDENENIQTGLSKYLPATPDEVKWKIFKTAPSEVCK